MRFEKQISHVFVEYIPDEIQDGTLYISMAFATVAHHCFCGCGNEVVTPLSPTDWTLIFDGETVSLDPSIGNWSLPCQSHYWIRRNRVKWAPHWSQKEIEAGRDRARIAKEVYFRETARDLREGTEPIAMTMGAKRLWLAIRKWLPW